MAIRDIFVNFRNRVIAFGNRIENIASVMKYGKFTGLTVGMYFGLLALVFLLLSGLNKPLIEVGVLSLSLGIFIIAGVGSYIMGNFLKRRFSNNLKAAEKADAFGTFLGFLISICLIVTIALISHLEPSPLFLGGCFMVGTLMGTLIGAYIIPRAPTPALVTASAELVGGGAQLATDANFMPVSPSHSISNSLANSVIKTPQPSPTLTNFFPLPGNVNKNKEDTSEVEETSEAQSTIINNEVNGGL